MDKAIEDPMGARVPMGTQDRATFFRMRCHTARQINRKDSKEIYPVGDVRYGISPYDSLTFRLKEDESGEWWVYAEKSLLEPGSIESLSELEG